MTSDDLPSRFGPREALACDGVIVGAGAADPNDAAM
jgi:hypothetical protein